MIRVCDEEDKFVLEQFLNKNPILHTYIIADLEQYGFDKEYQTVYIQEQDGICRGVFLKYYNNLILSKISLELTREEACGLLSPEITNIMGDMDSVYRFAGQTDAEKKVTENYLYAQKTPLCSTGEPEGTRIATAEDVDRIYSFLMEFPEFAGIYSEKGMIENRIRTNEGIHIFIEKDGKIIAHGNSAASAKTSCFLGGICVAEPYRGKGYAIKIIDALCREIHRKDKIPCIFAPMDKEYSIFRKAGFDIYGKWGTMQIGGRK